MRVGRLLLSQARRKAAARPPCHVSHHGRAAGGLSPPRQPAAVRRMPGGVPFDGDAPEGRLAARALGPTTTTTTRMITATGRGQRRPSLRWMRGGSCCGCWSLPSPSLAAAASTTTMDGRLCHAKTWGGRWDRGGKRQKCENRGGLAASQAVQEERRALPLLPCCPGCLKCGPLEFQRKNPLPPYLHLPLRRSPDRPGL